MIKPRLVFLVCFLAAFGAGLCVGLLCRQQPPKQQREGWLSELNLTAEQREGIKAIWTDAMKASDWQSQREKREAAQKERDEALRALITSDQQQRFEELMATYQKKAEEISQEGRKARDEAYERTKALLTETQRVMYDELRKKRLEAHGRARGDASKKPSGGPAAPADAEQKKTEGAQQPK